MAGLVMASLVMSGIVTVAHAHRKDRELTRAQRGLVYDGLRAKDRGHCRGLYRLELPDGPPTCSHGPDEAPDGIDVTERPSVADLADATVSGGQTTTGVPCITDGTSGARVQAVYAVASDQPDRYANIAPLIATWAGQMDSAVAQSAAETGGELHLRFATKPDCSLDVAHVVLSPSGDDSLANTITELRNKGLSATNRKYLIWADATVYCGIGQVTGSDVASSSNPANSGPNYGRVDTGCWGRSDHLSELHELMHTLGAVQLSAPHSSGGYHCTDENDLMCYVDASGVTMTYACPSAHEWLLDCNHDDYFSTAPAGGSYLASHWNVANSVFLAGAAAAPLPSPTPTPSPSPSPTPSPSPSPTVSPPKGTLTATYSGSISSKRPSKRFALTVGTGLASNDLSFSATGGGGKGKGGGGGGLPSLQLRILASDGTALVEGSGPSVLRFASTLPAGAYTWEIVGTSSVSFTLTVTYAAP
jgi:hypothetical protein